jgi:HEAT repeat protein
MSDIPEHASARVLVSRLALDGERWRHEAEDALVQMGDKAVEVLLGALGHANPMVRFHAVRALCRLRAKRAIPVLVQRLGDTENHNAVAIAAEKALVDFGTEAILSLLEVAKSGPEGVRPRAVRALGRIQGAPSEVFRELTRSPDWTVRAQAYAALARTAGDAAVPDLIAALSDPEDWVRRAAAEALVDLRRAEGKALLQAVLDNPDEEFNQHVWAENLLDRLEELERTGNLVK